MKVVTFDPKVKVYNLCVWNYANIQARKGPWEQIARDRVRFHRRIRETEKIIGSILERSWKKLNLMSMN